MYVYTVILSIGVLLRDRAADYPFDISPFRRPCPVHRQSVIGSRRIFFLRPPLRPYTCAFSDFSLLQSGLLLFFDHCRESATFRFGVLLRPRQTGNRRISINVWRSPLPAERFAPTNNNIINPTISFGDCVTPTVNAITDDRQNVVKIGVVFRTNP